MKVNDTFTFFKTSLILQVSNAMRELEAHLCAYIDSVLCIPSPPEFSFSFGLFLSCFSIHFPDTVYFLLSNMFPAFPPCPWLLSQWDLVTITALVFHCLQQWLLLAARPDPDILSFLLLALPAVVEAGKGSPCELFDTLGSWHLWEVKK